jgi:glycosyltransferase involved in cell wall biosynthesis
VVVVTPDRHTVDTLQPVIRLLAVANSKQFSGAEVALMRVLLAAGDRGWERRVAGPAGPFGTRLSDAGIHRAPIPQLSLGSGPRPVAAAALAARTALAGARLRAEARRADVVFVNGLLALPAVALAQARMRQKVPVVWFVHDVVQRRDRLAVLRRIAPTVDLAIAVSNAAAEPVRQAGVRTVVVHHGTEWPVEPATQPPPVPTVIGCAAALTSWKGQDVLLEAAELLPIDVLIELAGGSFPKDGAFVERLHQLADRPALRGRVRFLGKVDGVLDRMRTWTVCVSASVDPEAGPLQMFEAMSVGVPFVGTNHGGVPEVLGDAGLTVAPGDATAMAAGLQRLLDDDGLRRRCAAAGPRIIADGYQLHQQVSRVVDIVEETAASRRR